MLNNVDKVWKWLAEWIVTISGVTVCVLIFAGAIARYVFHTDFYGSEELILLAAFWLYFTGSALAARNNTQIKAEMLDMFIKNKTVLSIANVIKNVISLCMTVMASIWSIEYVLWIVDVNMRSSVFRFPVYLSVLPVAISFVAWTVYCIRDIALCVKDLNNMDSAKEGK